MSDEVKLCRDCKWLSHDGLSGITGLQLYACDCLDADAVSPEEARSDPNDCGPSGKYWEPKK